MARDDVEEAFCTLECLHPHDARCSDFHPMMSHIPAASSQACGMPRCRVKLSDEESD
jgi:hypothetical protein